MTSTRNNFLQGKVERILIPVDFSPKSSLSIDHAVVMAKAYGASIWLMHVLDGTIFVAGSVPGVLIEIRDRCQVALEGLAESVRERGLECTVLLCEGDLDQEIEKVIVDCHIDVLVLATKAGTALAGFSFISTAERILRKTTIPVLTVADCHPVRKWPGDGCFHIFYATDLSPESLRSLDHARALERRLCVEFTIAHVVSRHSSEAEMEAVATQLKELAPGITDHVAVLRGPAGPAICEASQKAGADLVVIGVKKHSFIREVFFGHTLLEILGGVCCPVLTIRI